MKRIALLAMSLVMIGLSPALKAEKKNVLVKQHLNITVQSTENYQVNGQGDIVTYQFSKDDAGVITAIYYTYTKKSGQNVVGEIGKSNKPGVSFIPANSTDFQIVGLERNLALCLFTTLLGDRVYMVFRLVTKNAIPTPNRNNYIQHTALVNEECTMTNTQVVSKRYANVRTITKRQRVDNVATLTTSTAHSLKVGDLITVVGVSASGYNVKGAEVLATPTFETFQYLSKGDDEAETSTSGSTYLSFIIGQISSYNHNWVPQNNKGIDNKYGNLYVINPPIQRYYQGVEPTADTTKFNIYILKP